MLEEVRELIEKTARDASSSNGIVEVDLFFTLSVINALWSMVAGARFSHDNPELQHLMKLNAEFFKASSFVGDFSMAFPFLREYIPWITNRAYTTRLSDQVLDFAKKIHDTHKKRESYATNPESFVDIFLAKIDEEEKLPENERIFTGNHNRWTAIS